MSKLIADGGRLSTSIKVLLFKKTEDCDILFDPLNQTCLMILISCPQMDIYCIKIALF